MPASMFSGLAITLIVVSEVFVNVAIAVGVAGPGSVSSYGESPSGSLSLSLRVASVAKSSLLRVDVREPKEITKVWITSFSRSGSSTMEQLVDIGYPASQHLTLENYFALRQSQFALFEPCHEGDIYRGKKITKNDLSMCPNFLHDVMDCNFSAVQKLFYWDHPKARHTNVQYSGLQAERDCRRAAVRVFKTITMNNMAQQVLPVLKADPSLRILHLIRDPRAIFASRLHTPSYKHVNNTDILEMCNQMQRNARITHPRLLDVKFEDWITNPLKLSEEVYNFLGLRFGRRQKLWIKDHFNTSSDVPCRSRDAGPFGSCRLNSTAVAFKWRHQLNQTQLQLFEADSCQKALKLYGYRADL